METLSLSTTATVAVQRNKEALALAARVTAGNVINDKLVDIIGTYKQTPTMVKIAASTPVGKAVIANAFASAITHFMPQNKRALQASEAMVEAAMLEFVGSFNIEEMVEDLLSGINLPAESSNEGE